MAIFKVTVAGRDKPLLIKAEGKREAYARIITKCEPLNADEMEAALHNGETVWREGDPIPVEPAKVEAIDADDGNIADGQIDPVGALRKAGEEASQ